GDADLKRVSIHDERALLAVGLSGADADPADHGHQHRRGPDPRPTEPEAAQMSPVLEVRDLRTEFFTAAGTVRAVNDVSFSLNEGEIIGLVGESGSGKSVTGFSLLGLIDAPGKITGGSVRLKGDELVGMAQPDLRRRRGAISR